MLEKQIKRQRRHRRVRAKISGTIKVPRLCIFRSNKYIYAQLIDDEKNKVLISASDIKSKSIANKKTGKKIDSAKAAGQLLAKKALDKKIKKVVFDRGGYKYHGRVRAVAEGAREGGLEF